MYRVIIVDNEEFIDSLEENKPEEITKIHKNNLIFVSEDYDS